jgi:guanylate kinase
VGDDFKLPSSPALLIVLSGASGVGKDTILQRMKERGMPFHFVITATSRPPRQGEVDGQDYFFVSKDEFAHMIEQGELLEHAIVYGQHKGIPKQQVRQALESGQDVVMRIDVQGAETVRSLCPEALLIYLMPETEEALIRRLRLRQTESADQLQLRIDTARQELRRIQAFDYFVVNADHRLDEAVDVIRAIIDAEHHRVHARRVTL